MNTRVVVTGMGAITPIGNDVESFWSAIKSNTVGIAPITHFDTADFKCKLAAEVKDFDPKQYMDPKTARRMETFCQFAVAAAKEALETSGIDMEKEDPFRVGVSVGSGIGSLQALERNEKRLLEKGPGRVEPLLVPLMISNMAAGNVSIQFGLKGKTGIDLPGEAATIMHKKEKMGAVELATVSFGQSFQITPIQLITTAASIVNGGRRVTPHFGVRVIRSDGGAVKELSYPQGKQILSSETSASMRYVLEQVVAEGSGKRAALEGFRIGGKTATSEKLPRSLKKYISSFLGFAPADDPRVMALITIDEPQGIYYGGTIAAPVIGELFKNILPYMGIRPEPKAG